MGKIICITNNKGGIGKSTISQNLSAGVSMKNRKVLLIDGDPQSNTTKSMIPSCTSVKNSFYDLLDDKADVDIASCIYPTIHKNLWLLPNESETSNLEIPLIRNYDLLEISTIVKDKLRNYCLENFDYVFIDTPPSLGLFLLVFLTLSDELILPVKITSNESINGVQNVLKLTKDSKITTISKMTILTNMVDRRYNACKANLINIENRFSKKNIFNTSIPTSGEIINSEQEKPSTVFTISRHSKASVAFLKLANEFLKG